MEDEIELYENRMVRTLIDQLVRYTNALWHRIEDARREIDNALDWNELGRDCSDYRRVRMLSVLIPDFDAERLLNKREEFLKYEIRVRNVRRVLTHCLATRFYHAICRAAAVHSPLKATNILLMDAHYHRLYLLWNALDRELRRSEDLDTVPLPSRIEPAYASYAAVLLFVGLNLAGFRLVSNAEHKIISMNAQGDLVFEACYTRHDWTVTVKASMDADVTFDLHFAKRQVTHISIPPNLPAPISFPSELSHIVTRNGMQLIFVERPTPSEVALLGKLPLVGGGGIYLTKKHRNTPGTGDFLLTI